jgi:hypothetical protein
MDEVPHENQHRQRLYKCVAPLFPGHFLTISVRTEPVVSSVNIPTIPLTVAQAMSPPPRPPSPTARDATQKALRRTNPNQLSNRDAQVLLMGNLPSGEMRGNGGERARIESFFTNDTVPSPIEPETPISASSTKVPPRPYRETRPIENGQSQSDIVRRNCVARA